MRPFPNDELLFDYKLSDLVRYNHRHKIKNESVAEHSYYVTLFCLKICSFYRFDDKTTSRILAKAILHDLYANAVTYADLEKVTKYEH